MKIYRILFLLLASLGVASADVLTWGNTYQSVWSGFGTSPYIAVDQSQNDAHLAIYCLDFNDEIAPPYTWEANFVTIDPYSVATYAQFGGNYNARLSAAWEAGVDPGSVPSISVVFGINSGNSPLTAASDSAFVRYKEAAWLFNRMKSGQVDSVVYQVAAWELFVESGANTDKLQYDITHSPGAAQADIDAALVLAQAAVTGGWSDYTSWHIVTADPDWVDDGHSDGKIGQGKPAQEFLTYSTIPGPVPDILPTPEPSGILLLLSVLGASAFTGLRKARGR